MSIALMLLLIASSPHEPPLFLEHADFPKPLQQKAFAATLRVKNPETFGEGTAVRIKCLGPWVYYLTAAHVVGKSQSVDLESFDPETLPKVAEKFPGRKVLAVWPDKDLAILRGGEEKPGPCINPIPENLIPKTYGFPVLTIGCTGGLTPTLVFDKVKDRKRVHIPDEKRVGWCWEAGIVPEKGRSGGPMIDKSGFLIGICSGTSDKIGFYVDASEIRAVLAAETKSLLEPDEKVRK